jgi:glycosyltransferase involved in cell wall biosynthesis
VRVGLATIHNIRSRPARGASYIFEALSSRVEVEHLGAEMARRTRSGGASRFLHRRFGRMPRYASLERTYAAMLGEQLKTDQIDLLVGLFASNIIAQIEVPDGLPVVHVSDTTCHQLLKGSGYPATNTQQMRHRLELERQTLLRADLCVFPSTWAARSAIDDFGVPAERVHAIEWGGANLKGLEPRARNAPSPDARIELLFVGGSWKRKGLDRVVAATEDISSRGRSVRLTVVGTQVPRMHRSSLVRSYGKLDLQHDRDQAIYEETMRTSTCLVHPARAECYGHALVEACERGLPVICSRVGGMPMIIRDGENGLLIENDDDVGELVERILRVADDPEFALALSEQGRQAWTERLSWKSWADRFIELVTPLVLARQP